MKNPSLLKIGRLSHSNRVLIAHTPLELVVRTRKSGVVQASWKGLMVLANDKRELEKLFTERVFNEWDMALSKGIPSPLFDHLQEILDLRPDKDLEDTLNEILKAIND